MRTPTALGAPAARHGERRRPGGVDVLAGRHPAGPVRRRHGPVLLQDAWAHPARRTSRSAAAPRWWLRRRAPGRLHHQRQDGTPVPLRQAGPTLIWQRGAIGYRLEGADGSMAQAAEIGPLAHSGEASQSSMPCSSSLRTASGAADALIDCRASSASSASREAVAPPAPARTAAAAGTRTAAGRRPRARSAPPRRTACAAARPRRRSTTPSPTLEVGQTSQRITPARPAAPSAAGPPPPAPRARPGRRRRSSTHCATLRGPSSSPPCGTASSPARLAIAEGPRRSRGPGRAARRWTARTRRPPGPMYCAASRASVLASSGCLVRLAATTTAMPIPASRRRPAAPRPAPAPGSAVSPPNRVRVAGRVHLDLQPAASPSAASSSAVSRTSRWTSSGRPQHRPGDVVQPLEAEPAALVGRPQLGRPVLLQRVGQVQALLAGELDQRGVPHRPGEVQVQMGLGQRVQGPCHRHILPLNAPGLCLYALAASPSPAVGD